MSQEPCIMFDANESWALYNGVPFSTLEICCPCDCGANESWPMIHDSCPKSHESGVMSHESR